MKKLTFPIFLLILLICVVLNVAKGSFFLNKIQKNEVGYRGVEGDIVFQTTSGSLSEAIRLATHSNYCHCGIILKKDGNYYVEEALEPVRLTPLDKWLSLGRGGHYAVKRLRNAENILSDSTLTIIKRVGATFLGKHYDGYFEWSDDRIYCSELVWKIYKRATGIEVGKPEKLKDFDLTSNMVKQEMKERYGNNIPYNETVVSPSDILNSDLLVTVVVK